jgi:eRF1 domain 2
VSTMGLGTAALCLLSEHMTVIRQRIDVPVPRKRTGSSSMHDKGLERFYNTLYSSFLRHIPYSSLRVVVIASPGFVKEAVYDYIFAEAVKTNNKPLLQARNKFLRVHISSPHVHSLVEVLKSPEVAVHCCAMIWGSLNDRYRRNSRKRSLLEKGLCWTSKHRVQDDASATNFCQIFQNARFRRRSRMVRPRSRRTCG